MASYTGTVTALANAGSGSDVILFTFSGSATAIAWTANNVIAKATLLASYSGARFSSDLPSFGYFNFYTSGNITCSVESPSGTVGSPSNIAWASGTAFTNMVLGTYPKPTTFTTTTFTAIPVAASKVGMGGGF